MKRVYTTAGVEAADGGFVVRLDKRVLRSPAGAAFVLPTEGLARSVAAEWDAQTAEIRPDTMPLMQLAATAVDLVAKGRDAIVDATAEYADTDLLCYRAERPQSLVERQAAVWQPLLDWAARRYDVAFAVHAGIMPRPQPETTLTALRSVVAASDDWRLAALQAATAVAGSLVIALALLDGEIGADAAFEAAQLDETHEIEQWGEDAEATARRARLRADLTAARRFVDLLADR
jgi:chaperone required for assembly of F1-ATPase